MSALNLLGNLLSVTYHRIAATPDVVYILAWDDRRELEVCWMIVDDLDKIDQDVLFETAYLDICEGDLKYSDGLAYVTTSQTFNPDEWYIQPVHLTHNDYAALVAEAEAQR